MIKSGAGLITGRMRDRWEWSERTQLGFRFGNLGSSRKPHTIFWGLVKAFLTVQAIAMALKTKVVGKDTNTPTSCRKEL